MGWLSGFVECFLFSYLLPADLDIASSMNTFVPLSRLMAEQIAGLKLPSSRSFRGYSTRALPVPFTTSPMSHALCFWLRMNFSAASACSADTTATMPTPMLKTW